jgi:hypothetical protein
MIPAANDHVPIARMSERSAEDAGAVMPRAVAGANGARLGTVNAFEASHAVRELPPQGAERSDSFCWRRESYHRIATGD